MILDVSLVLIVSVFLFIGYKKGIVKSVYGFLSLIVAGVGSYFSGKYLSQWVYGFFFEKSINESISNSVSASTENLTASVENVLSNLPEYVKNLLGFFNVSEGDFFQQNTTAQLVESELQQSIKGAVVEVLGFIFIIVLFILILILMRLLSKPIVSIFEIPVIKQINGIFGMLFGLAEGLVICYIAVLVFRLIVPDAHSTLLNAEMFNNSVIFSRIYYSEFITYVTELFVA